jgi:hypothetical protein
MSATNNTARDSARNHPLYSTTKLLTSKPRAYSVKAYSTTAATSPVAATTIPRHEPTDRDVQLEILFCGVCHSDLHFARNE